MNKINELNTSLSIPRADFDNISRSLKLENSDVETVGFLFAEVIEMDEELILKYLDWYLIPEELYEIQSAYYVELKDEVRPIIIKKAVNLNATIVEIHTHISKAPAKFSITDFEGFKDFVPHVRWRLENLPYAAVVLSQDDFDAVIWYKDSKQPIQLNKICVGRDTLQPNGKSLMDDMRYG